MTSDPSDDDRLADLLIRWEELRDQGREVSAADLCQDCPSLAEPLARRIAALRGTAWMEQPVEAGTDCLANSDAKPPLDSRRPLGHRYRLDQLIAEGGFAQVWKGYDLELLRTVAIKMPKRSRQGVVDLFLAEARRVARLKHPGIVSVHDVGREGDVFFIVSEFIEEGSLADRLTQGPIPPRQAVQWICEIADTLDYAHRHSVIHRDIKPANILIDHHGRAMLADFGIALSSHKTGEFAPSIGTLSYMSPEQLEGKPLDPRSDLYSVGVLLVQLLTGQLPYDGHDANHLRREIVSGVTRLSGNRPGLTPDLQRIALKCLATDPQQRYATARDLVNALRSVPDLPATRPFLWPGVLFLVLLVSSTALVIAQRMTQKAPAEIVTQQEAGKQAPHPQPPTDPEESQLSGVHRELAQRIRQGGGTVTAKGDQLVALDLLKSTSLEPPLLHQVRDLGTVFRMNLPASIGEAHLEAIRGMRGLRILRAGGCQMTDAGLAQLATLPDLEFLELTGSRITDEGLQALDDLPLLTWLDLSHTGISDRGLLSWKVPAGLRVLRLNFNSEVTDASLHALTGLANPELLEFAGTRVTSQGIESLKQSHPRCKLVGNMP
jgi:serine/threonine protein kinase